MTLKQKVHDLELPDDSQLLHEFRETAELNKALAKGVGDLQNGRVYSEEEFISKVRALWPSSERGTGCGAEQQIGDRHPAAAVLSSNDDSEATGSRAD